jgi:hypothetical protein
MSNGVTDLLTHKSMNDLERALKERRDLAPVRGIPITNDEMQQLVAAIERGMSKANRQYKMEVLQAAIDWMANAKLQRALLGHLETGERTMITGMSQERQIYFDLVPEKREAPPAGDQTVTLDGQ